MARNTRGQSHSSFRTSSYSSAFVIYPICYGLWMGSSPHLYAELFSDPIYQQTLVNTLMFLAFGVNLKLFFGLLLSGFFMRKGWWVKALLMLFVLPWAVPALPSFISIHWMLIGEWGFINNALWHFFGLEGPYWLNDRWLALGSAIYAHLWKWLPFWTVILLAGRMSISQEVYDAAAVDGATGFKRFLYVTFPLLANLYLVLTLAGDDLPARRLQLDFLRDGRRARQLDASAGDARHPQRLRDGQSAAWRRRGDVGAAADDPARNHSDAPA